jgi:hypothetical protein
MPKRMLQPQVVSTKDYIYVGGGPTNSCTLFPYAFAYNIAKDTWKMLPNTPTVLFGMCYFQGSLVTVGGLQKHVTTDKVYSLKEEMGLCGWEEALPPMQTKRFAASVFPVNSILIACGGGEWIGMTQEAEPFSSVEVYRHETKTWSYAESLPKPGAAMPYTISGKTCYLLRYSNEEEGPIYTAEVPNTEEAFKLDWTTVCPPPIANSSIVATESYLLAIGGEMKKKDIHIYIKETQEWMKLVHGALPQVARGCGLAVMETTGEVIVVGGEDSAGRFSNSVFIGKLL